MKIPVCLACILAMLLTGCGDKAANSSGSSSATNAAKSSGAREEGSPLTAPVDYLGAVGKAHQTAIKTVDTATINQAIQLFNVENGRNPKDLNELVAEKFLPRIPEAPYGMKLVYDAASGTVKVVKQ